jgi:hypothetical protein
MTPKQKKELIKLAQKHYDADQLVQGTYGGPHDMNGDDVSVFKGCSVGCMAYDLDIYDGDVARGIHADLAEYFSLPKWVVLLQDGLFEMADEYAAFHVDWCEALPCHDCDGPEYEALRQHLVAAMLECMDPSKVSDPNLLGDVVRTLRAGGMEKEKGYEFAKRLPDTGARHVDFSEFNNAIHYASRMPKAYWEFSTASQQVAERVVQHLVEAEAMDDSDAKAYVSACVLAELIKRAGA